MLRCAPLSSLLLVTLLASCHSPAPRVTTVRRVVASLARSPGALIHAEVVLLLSRSRARTPTARHQQELSRLYSGPAAVRFVTPRGLTGAGQELHAALNQIQDHGLDPLLLDLPELDELLTSLKRTRSTAAAAELELHLAAGLLTFADALGTPLAAADLRQLGPDRQRARALLRRVMPRNPQYAKLVAAHRVYREIVEHGGWPTLRGRRLRGLQPGTTAVAAREVKVRLAREGFYDGPPDARYDARLTAALVRYQRAHQLEPSGRLDRATLRSLNVPAEQRLLTLRIALHRWRASKARHGGYHVLVNIPDFHLEVWRGDERLMRQRVVVGQHRPRKCDERSHRVVLAHATPVQSASIESLVFAPTWNVTRDIKEKELDPHGAMRPDYYQRNGYELLDRETGGERVRQLPGPGNALGFVKFLFPNRHDVYLHDTPQRRFFQKPVRAYSHGCIRVQRPFELARLILGRDGQWDEQRYRKLQRRWRGTNLRSLRSAFSLARYERLRRRALGLQRRVELGRPVPIHVEYITARVADDGAVHFLGDIYGRDRDLLSPRVARRCVPESALARRRAERFIERLERLEQRAEQVAPYIPQAMALAQAALTDTNKRLKRLRRRARRMASFVEHHQNMARRIRAEQAALTGTLEDDGRWRSGALLRARKIDRLLQAMAKMTLRTRTLCAQILKAAMKAPAALVGKPATTTAAATPGAAPQTS